MRGVSSLRGRLCVKKSAGGINGVWGEMRFSEMKGEQPAEGACLVVLMSEGR